MSKKASGICNVHYAKWEGNTLGTPKPIPGLESISVTENYAEGSNYADNLKNIYIKELVSADMSLQFSNISREIEADLTGQQYENGQMIYTTNAVAPNVALLFQKNYSDGSYDNIVYYNCLLTKDNENGETKTDSFNFTGDSLSGQALPLKSGEIKYVISSEEAEGDSLTKLENFFTQVQYIGEAPQAL